MRVHNRRARVAEPTTLSESDREAIYDLFEIPHWRAHSLLGLADWLGALDSEAEVKDRDLWFEARMELVIDGARVERERKWPDDIRDYLLERIKEPERGRITMRARDKLLVWIRIDSLTSFRKKSSVSFLKGNITIVNRCGYSLDRRTSLM